MISADLQLYPTLDWALEAICVSESGTNFIKAFLSQEIIWM